MRLGSLPYLYRYSITPGALFVRVDDPFLVSNSDYFARRCICTTRTFTHLGAYGCNEITKQEG